MNEKYIRQLIQLVEESKIESLEVSSWGRKIRITQKLSQGTNGNSNNPPVVNAADVAALAPARVEPSSTAQVSASEVTPETSNLIEVKSPMVGTFYAAPSPDTEPYVSLNEKITSGQVVCIVEAMKLMNEIESETSGRIVEICAENAKPVEFGQVLFRIDPKR